MTKITFHVISHTHWDREWYLPFETFRIELVELIDDLLDILEQNKDFIFHLDGQSIILQDYLEIRPHKREQVAKFVKSGNLLAGPWYVLSDQFLTSGEATIRNLLYGIKDAQSFGGAMLIGYLPDQFGQIAQLPQILKGFSIHSAVVGRGIQDSASEHNWYGLNGESILAVALTHWYNNAQRFPTNSEKLHNYLETIYNTQAETSCSGHVLLMNGCDHLVAQRDLPQILHSVTSNKKWELKQDKLPNALNNIENNLKKEDYPIYFGELRDDNNKYILAGTLSSRVYLKLENYKCQTLLEKIIEPLATLLALSKKVNYPYDELKYAWRILLQNHAHDSICGCSIDEVHREMETRFAKVSQVADKLKENLLRSLTSNLQTSEPQTLNVMRSFTPLRMTPSVSPPDLHFLQLINLTNYHRSDFVETELEFPLGPPAEHPSASPTTSKTEIKNITLKDGDKEVELEILESKQTCKMIRSKDEVPLLQAIQKTKVLFRVDIEPFSIKSYEIVQERVGEWTMGRIGENLEFENQNYKLEINKDGTLSVLLKDGNYKFKNIHFLTIEDDLGDEYNFVSKKDSKVLDSKNRKWQLTIIEENKFRKIFFLTSNELPEFDIETEITCYKSSPRIDFKTKINNKCKNKRIRLHFPTALNTEYIACDTPFGILTRARPPQDWINYATSQPLHNWIAQNNREYGLTFLGGGLADYELYKDGNGFAITLIRAVGKLSNVKSHSLIETPDAQCIREMTFFYSIYPHTGKDAEVNISREALVYQTPILVNQSQVNLHIRDLILVTQDLMISAFKRAEDKENIYVLRVFNPYNKKLEKCKLYLNFSFRALRVLNLNEENTNNVDSENGRVEFEINPYQILTFGIEV